MAMTTRSHDVPAAFISSTAASMRRRSDVSSNSVIGDRFDASAVHAARRSPIAVGLFTDGSGQPGNHPRYVDGTHNKHRDHSKHRAQRNGEV